MKTNIILLLVIFVSSCVLSACSLIPVNNNLNQVSAPVITVPKTTPIESKYSVKIISKPKINNEEDVTGKGIWVGKISVSAEITNTSVAPYIIDFSLINCKVLDTKGNIYPADSVWWFKNVNFNKAILPGESRTVNITTNDMNLTTSKCSYDSNGNNVCQKFTFLRIDSCHAVVAVDGNHHTDLGAGLENPPEVFFP